MTTVIWSPRSKTTLARIFRYIAAHDPQQAMRVGQRLLDGGNGLGKQLSGRPGRYARHYEKSLTDINYILHYRLRRDRDEVVIIDIVHSRRDWQHGQMPPT